MKNEKKSHWLRTTILVLVTCGIVGLILSAVLFFRDPHRENSKDVTEIARLCDQHSIPFATNVATAEVLIRGLKDGYLDWRDIVNPKK